MELASLLETLYSDILHVLCSPTPPCIFLATCIAGLLKNKTCSIAAAGIKISCGIHLIKKLGK